MLCITTMIVLFHSFKCKRIDKNKFVCCGILISHIALIYASMLFSRPVISDRQLNLDVFETIIFQSQHNIDTKVMSSLK